MASAPDIEERWAKATAWAISAFAVISASTVAALIDERLWHWYLIPVTACGVLAGVDVVEWARKRLDTFDPQALLGLFGFHFFFLAPVLHVLLGFWPAFINPLTDWRAGLGVMATINAAGLILYRFVIGLRLRPVSHKPSAPVDPRRFVRAGKLAVVVGMLGFAAVVAKFGGPAGYLASASDDRGALAGTGWLLLVAESFPLVGFIVYVIARKEKLINRPRLLTAAIALFGLTQFVVGGLRGSRSNTIWPVLIGLIVVHLLIRPIRRRRLLVLAAVFVAFMYGYGVYKSAGSATLQAVDGSGSISELSTDTGRTLPAMLLGDLGRADIQAVILDRQQHDVAPVSYGATYLGALGFMVPDSMRPDWMASKVEVGTDMLYGVGTADAGGRSSRIYGLAGEAILNFGPVGALLSFIALAVFIRAARRRYLAAPDQHLGTMVFSAVVCVCAILALGSDLDNLLWFLVKTTLPIAAVVFAARKSGSAQLSPAAVRT
ncbi:hypothetical protein [Actinoplanes sp. NPDC049316]|uniref:hypothetical protein n=1 Tax=Actinoplanes sp. NPDC049316 TaxID=3154727 RepID=UPI0034346266